VKYFTQSILAPHGNCWQTAVACLLGVEPDTLPPQSEIEAWPNAALDGWGGYSNCLQGYLRAHHNLCYITIREHEFTAVRAVRPEMILSGPTVRTAQARLRGEKELDHAIVGVNGIQVWDPHPSRDGLLHVIEWGLLAAHIPRLWDEEHTARQERLRKHSPAYGLVFDCLCPFHNLNAARDLALNFPS
jgi:hypothetical protein